jgi:exodeoxyribonuclease (lambda-induced)
MMTSEQKAAWLAERCGCLTASNMWKAMAYSKQKGKEGQPLAVRTDYLFELLAERQTGFSMPHVVTDPMLHGQEYEDEAVDKFVELTGRDVRLSRFYLHSAIANFGATPDRELDDGLLEVKCPTTPKYLRWKMAGVVPDEHKPQMLAQLACTGKKWCGFIAYDPRVKDERLRLFLARYEPAPDEVRAVEVEAIKFLNELDTMWERLTTGQAA